MRLAATLTTVRDAARRPVSLRGTLRDPGDTPNDVVILDLSETGFLAELPAGLSVEPGTRVRVAATPLGLRDAVAVRGHGRQLGFAFVTPLPRESVERASGDQPSNVAPFPGLWTAPEPAARARAVATEQRISARASLALIVGASMLQWLALAAVAAGLSLLR